jgi:uncharacterized protein (TIRG00374 family)
MTDRASGADRKRRLAATLVTLVTLVVVFALVLPQLGDYGEAWDAVRSMSGSAVILLALLTIANILIYPWPYQAAVIGLTYRPSFVVSQTSFAISNGVPGGGALGVAVQYRMLGDYGFGPDAATAAVGVNAVSVLLAKVTMPVIALALLIVVGETQVWVVPAFLIGFVLVGLAIGLLVALFHSEGSGHRIGEWANRLVNWVAGFFGEQEAIDVKAKLLELRASTRDLLQRRVTSISVANVVVQFLSFFVFFVALRGIESQASMKTTAVVAFAAFSIGRLGDFVPLTPGGLGTVDALMTGLLVGFGTNESDALAATLVWRAATYFPQIVIGLGTYRSWHHWRQKTDRATPA